MIDGVEIFPLRRIPDERGMVMHMLRADDPHFQNFGEIYFSVIYPGVIKGWHLHSKMIINYAVVDGNIKLALFDQRADSKTHGEVQEIIFGQINYQLVRIPPGVVNGFTAVGGQRAVVANCASMPHDPAEITRIDPFTPTIPYDWRLVHR
ncbi:MAG: dTDP-4-dehydrorhamnose 3,5-epimerase family protein [Dehalococcoidia bacterium]|jgi:dTDP-4-dehydrorhamnose 3,5-epimerase|nr:dTDP-4-dehydrorhamnose 3,5-epimerase [Acidobacteriota bacterium]MDP6419934.1 dTDP-4-dehydrorhamnose 3,5-epimerase family protein [SAR202 cluster bacterium]MDP6824359.1 dTDP-4-dehydrorhamnose 3,5-epimerase family protein [Dehalococcoidia bacterium]MDP6662998.1 dTDP-4-dehydrorhamnose 3,5-epimerase family protein [SAR202 cluster bacterium]MQG59368.1 dTDP-4-dehydrorhamnose 3,5-epimerase [SAR202 cluster bacterium]|tara:strand:+ start:1440 stop:1889 length:450 start_codon:yes stop_codon:yes gene_type:complete